MVFILKSYEDLNILFHYVLQTLKSRGPRKCSEVPSNFELMKQII